MKTKVVTTGCVCLITLFFQSATLFAAVPKGDGKSQLIHPPAMFQPNVGQASKDLQYTAAGFGYSIGFSATSANLLLAHPGKSPASVALRFVGADPASIASPYERAQFHSNYFIGKKSITGIPNYGKLRYSSVWPGVDVVYYAADQQLEYDFVVAPQADPGAIRFRFDGAPVRLSANGELDLDTSAGQLVQRRAVAYQEIAGKRVAVAANYRVAADGSISLSLGKYDASQPLIIDPVVNFQAAQFLNLALDAYVVTDSLGLYTYIASTTVKQPIAQGSSTFYYFVLIVAYDNSGNVAANVQVGASDGDSVATGIDLDSGYNIYLTGYTNSGSALLEKNPLQATSGGGLDAFLIKLSSNFTSVLYGTYLGGNGNEQNCKVATSKVTNGIAYVVGQSTSTGWPTASTPAGTNGFLYAINTTQVGGASKVFALTLGGSGTDIATGVATDASGNIYVSGSTTSVDFTPTASTGYQITKVGANNDGFVLKLNSGGAAAWSTFYANAPANGVAQAGNRYAYVTGQTNGALTTTGTGYQLGQGANHAYFAKFDTAANLTAALNYSTYLAGSVTDAGTAIAVGANGRAYVGGWTTSSNFPVLGLPVVNQFNASHKNGFLAYVDPALTGTASLVYSTFISSTVDTQVTTVSASAAGDASVGVNGYDASGNEVAGLAVKVGSQIWGSDFFVKQLYLDLLDRPADGAGLAYWEGELNQGLITRPGLASQYFNSQEFQQGGLNIIKYYIAVLGRDPDYAGWFYWFNQYIQGLPLSTILNNFLTSPEFNNTYGSLSNQAFVSLVYTNVLGRPADSAGLAYWTNLLNTGALTRNQVMGDFIASAEFAAGVRPRAFANLLYMGFLRRSADGAGLAYWSGILADPNQLPTVINNFITSTEYVQRFM